MIKSSFKTAFKRLILNRKYTVVNVTGLAVGIAVCVTIFMIIQHQTSFDTFHPKKDRVFRVLTRYNSKYATESSYKRNVPFPMPDVLKANFPQLEQVAAVYASHNDEIQVLDDRENVVKKFKERNGVFYTSPAFFSMFNFPLLAGSYESLKNPNNVLLTKEVAETYFGDWEAALGKTIKIAGYYGMGAGLFQFPAIDLKVSGILASIPPNTDFQLKIAVAYGTDFTGDAQYGFKQPDWAGTAPDFGCYVLLSANTSADDFNRQLNSYVQNVQSVNNINSYVIQPLDAIHFDAETGNYSNKTTSHKLLNVLRLIAVFIILIACVNFVNLSTVQSMDRAKEVGVRKALGCSKSQLQVQFIIETFLTVICSVILASGIVTLVLPYLNNLLDLSLSFNLAGNPSIILFLAAITIIVTALAGFYPSVVLSRFNTVNTLKSKFVADVTKGISLRRWLVIFQFVVAQSLIIGTFIIMEQMNYFLKQPLGFDKEAIVNVPFRPDSTGGKLTEYLRHQLLSSKDIKAVSFSSNSPAENDDNVYTALKFDHAAKEAAFQAITKFADNDYVPTYKLQMVAGRNLRPSGPTKEFLVNESFVRKLGLKNPQEILNKEVSIMNDLIKCPVVGVLKDFNNRSLRQSLEPLLIATNETMYRQASIKISTENITSTIQGIKEIWERTFPDYVYEYSFLDNKIDSFYKQENNLAQLYKIFAAVAIFLSCLGLYCLASFMAVQRIKEIGIRKVLGATTVNIVLLFSKEFVVLIGMAFVIATPVTWYYLHQWLQNYAYRINISFDIFAAGGFVSVAIATLTVGFQAVKAAIANPVKSLKTE